MGDWESFLNEIRTISHIQHPNIMSFLGFFDRFGDDVGLVYPWISDNLDAYLMKRPDADRSQLCVQIAEGMLHLHSTGVIHGDLRPRNILVSDDGNVRIAGFGGAVLERETPDQNRYFQYVSRWAAPERMFDDEHSWRSSQSALHTGVELAELGVDTDPWIPSWPTTRSDVWSLAMTVYGALTDTIPYAELSELRAVYVASRQMLTPPRPDRFITIKKGFESILWSMLQACWAYNPAERPTVRAVRDIMRVIEREGQIPRPKVHSPAPGALIEHTTPLSGIVEHLVAHGCRDISQQMSTIDEGSRRSGRSSDVFTGNLLNGTLVAVKCLRTLSNSDTRPDKILKHTAHELYTWSISNHPNIVELLGLTVYHNRLSMVSPWMKYGSLLSYVHAYPIVNRYGLCVQVAEGLAYMHEQGVAHGDVKGDNVVVSDSGVAKLTDFGCATMKRDFPVYFTVTESLNYSVRWAAPELFLEDGLSSFETDVYALGMTILEAITGEVPHRDRGDRVIIHAVLVKREHPTRPIEYLPTASKPANEVWDMLERCWGYEPQNRPGINELRDFLKSIYQQDNWI